MPKKVSRKKTTKRPKKVSRKKSKRVTKRKPKYKRRKRRFGMYPGLQGFLERYSREFSDVTNAPTKALATGQEHKKSFDYKSFLKRISGEMGIQALYHKIGSGDLRKIGKNEPDDKLRRHKAFHTVLVAIISAILQLTDKVGRLQGNQIYTKARQESKFLSIFSKRQTYSGSGLQKYANLPREQTDITDFEIIDRNGVVMGFKHKFRGNTFEVSLTGHQQRESLVIHTIFTDLERRLPALRQDEKVDPEFLSLAEAYPKAYHDSYTTVVNLRSGDIVSTQDPQNDDQVEQVTTDLGAMTVNPLNTIVTNVHDVNETLKTFENPSEKELSEGLKKLSLSIDQSTFSENNPFSEKNPFYNIGPEIEELDQDGKPKAKDSDDDDNPFAGFFGRRKRKVSKKKGPSAALKKLCKSLKVKLTTKRGGKRVYKSEKVLKSQCKKAAKKSSFGKSKKKVSKKKGPSAALKKLCKRLKVKLTIKRGGKRVYKSEKVLKAQCKKAAKKSSFGKKKKRRRKRTSK